jgi:hypothetical protein
MNVFGKAKKDKISSSSVKEEEEAKKIFFEYSGNHLEMARNEVNFSKYQISREQEAEWRNEFIAYWRSQLSTEDLTAVQKLGEIYAVESIPDLLAIVDQGDSYTRLRIAEALHVISYWIDKDRGLRKQTRAAAIRIAQSILDNPVQVSERHKSEIARLGDPNPEDYIITFAKSIKGEHIKVPQQENIIPILHYPLIGVILILLAGGLTTLYFVLLDRLVSALSMDGDIYRLGIGIVALLLATGTILVFRRLNT